MFKNETRTLESSQIWNSVEMLNYYVAIFYFYIMRVYREPSDDRTFGC